MIPHSDKMKDAMEQLARKNEALYALLTSRAEQAASIADKVVSQVVHGKEPAEMESPLRGFIGAWANIHEMANKQRKALLKYNNDLRAAYNAADVILGKLRPAEITKLAKYGTSNAPGTKYGGRSTVNTNAALSKIIGGEPAPGAAVSSMIRGDDWGAEKIANAISEVEKLEQAEGAQSAAALAARKALLATYGKEIELIKAKYAIGGKGEALYNAEQKRISATNQKGLTNFAEQLGEHGFPGGKALLEKMASGKGFFGKLATAENASTEMTMMQKLASAGIAKGAGALAGASGLGSMAMALGPQAMLAAAIGKLIYGGIQEARRAAGAASAATFAGGGGRVGEGTMASEMVASGAKMRMDLAFSGKYLEFQQNAADAIGRMGDKSQFTKGTMYNLNTSFIKGQKAAAAFGIPAKDATDQMENLGRASNNMKDLYSSYNRFLGLTKAVGQSVSEANQGIGDLNKYSRMFGSGAVVGIQNGLLSVAANITGDTQKIQMQQMVSGFMTESGMPKMLGLAVAAYGSKEGPSRLVGAMSGGGARLALLGPDMIGKIVGKQIMPGLDKMDPAMKSLMLGNVLGKFWGNAEAGMAAVTNKEFQSMMTGKGIKQADIEKLIAEGPGKYDIAAQGLKVMNTQTDYLEGIFNSINEIGKALAAWSGNPLFRVAGPDFRNLAAKPNIPAQFIDFSATR